MDQKHANPLITPYVTQVFFFFSSFDDTRVHPFSSLPPRHSSHVRGPVCSAAYGGPDRLGLGVGLPSAGSQRTDSAVIPPHRGAPRARMGSQGPELSACGTAQRLLTGPVIRGHI